MGVNTMRMALLAALLGSGAAPAAEWRSEGPELGTINDLTVDPARPDTVYAATSNGGFWRSDDFGASWRRLGRDTLAGKLNWIEPDRADPDILWGGQDASGSGLLRSTDGGATWQVVSGPVKGELGRVHATGVRIAFAPSQPKTIFVPSTNLHYRSLDGGKTWTTFRVPDQDAYAIAIDPADPKRVYAGGRGQSHQISVSSDGGQTWRGIGAGLPERSFDQLLIPPQRPGTLYGLLGFNEVWKSTDAGETFEPLPKVAGMSATDDARIVLDPSHPDRPWLVGEGGVHRSDEYGNWDSFTRGTGDWQARALAIDPRDGENLLLGMAGDGVYRSEDGGQNWRPSRRGLNAGWIERLYAVPGQDGLWAQTTVGLFRRLPDGSWDEVRQPFSRSGAAEPNAIVFDRHAPGVLLGVDDRDLWRSTDGGTSWKPLPNPPKEPSLRQMMQGIIELPRPDFRCLAQHPIDAKRMYAGGDRDEPGQAVFRSVDGGKTWQAAGQGLEGRIDWLLAPRDGQLLAVNEDRALFRSDDEGGSWQRLSGGWPAAKLTQWVVDPTEPQRLFVATEQGLYRSQDGGQSWTRQSSGISDVEVHAVLVTPAGSVLAGTDSGVLLSRDRGDSFAPLDPAGDLGFVRALALGGEPLRLYVGTAVASVQSTAWVEP